MTRTHRWVPYALVAPFFLAYGIFGLYPTLYAFYLSMFSTTGIGATPTFAGLSNYVQLFSDSTFVKSLINTTYYALASIFIILPISFIVALAIEHGIHRAKQFFRVVYFLPNITSSVVAAIMFISAFETYGPIDNFLHALGLPRIGWLTTPAWIMPALVILGVWSFFGINALYYAAGIENIPRDLYEVAAIDGASGWRSLVHVTLPLLRPVVTFTVVLAIIGSYNLFAQPLLLYGGYGPNNAGLLATVYLYETGFQNLQFGYAAAMGVVLAAIIFVLSMIQLRFGGTFREEGSA